MSLEDELIELSQVYHGQREQMEEVQRQFVTLHQRNAQLLQMVQEYHAAVKEGFTLEHDDDFDVWEQRLIALQEQAALLIMLVPEA